jgi:hypothetical protein
MNESRPGIPGMPHLSPPHAPHAPTPQQPHAAPAQHAPHPPPLRPLAQPTGAGAGRAVIAPATHIPTEKELEPLTLVEEAGETTTTTSASSAAPKKMIAFGADLITTQHQWKRQPVSTGHGACRVKSFHGKYSDQGLEYLDNAINEWLDAHPEVEVKFVTPTVMTFEGKIREPALVLNIWY